jgi:hypothetical protein
MPLATDLVPLLTDRLELEEMRDWLDGMRARLEWLQGVDSDVPSHRLNIEEVFHYAYSDAEVYRLRQHLVPVGRNDGPGTPWNRSESISAWLSYLERALCEVILERDDRANLDTIVRWADGVNSEDSVVTFNYDTLVERALSEVGTDWNHGFSDRDVGVPVYKLHGSIDWIVAHRCDPSSKLDLLFDKDNANRSDQDTGHVEDDCRLWRCRTRNQLREWVSERDLQSIPKGAIPRTVGIAGLGAYKQLHQIPGLGVVWTRGMRAVYEADHIVVVGFSMSDFDAMAQLQFAEVARARQVEGHPLKVTVIDPYANDLSRQRFHRVFRTVEFIVSRHEEVDWAEY